MSNLRRGHVLTLVGSLLGSAVLGADLPGKGTHNLQPTLIEVAPAQPDGNAWDTGVGAFARPDPQVTLMRHDAKAQQETVELLVQATERKMKDLGRPVPTKFKELFSTSAMQTLRCGAAIEAFQDRALSEARGKFAADSSVASDSLLAKITDGALRVSLGDKISIFVNDIDLASHDLMGQSEVEITKELLTKGELVLKFNSIESLRLSVVPIAK
ncbi:MAG: hypothetical protein SFU86_14420 [Pirellulaceae bacterium]|nr:hypothetical protein [Pirellulaceae bacterium]